jgi:hypothetical protein
MGDIDAIIASIDFDGDGTIDFKEFLTATINAKKVTEEDVLKQAFDLFDIVIIFIALYYRMAMEKLPRKNFKEF